jgi:hypothetical protein
MDMVRVEAGIIAVPGELNLEFKLVALYGRITNRAVSADAWPTPHAVWVTFGELPTVDHCAGLLA